MPLSLFRTPSPLEQAEKKIVKEGKKEDSNVKHELKDLHAAEKAVEKAHKALQKAQHTLSKCQKEEYKAAETLNKATAAHEVSVINLNDAQKDLKLKQDREAQLRKDLAARKTEVEGVVSSQKAHNEEREAKLNQIHHERSATHDTHATLASEVSSGSAAAPPKISTESPVIQPPAGETAVTVESPVAEASAPEPPAQISAPAASA